jgi:hypothetical protein
MVKQMLYDFDELCDRLFNSEEDFWQSSADVAPALRDGEEDPAAERRDYTGGEASSRRMGFQTRPDSTAVSATQTTTLVERSALRHTRRTNPLLSPQSKSTFLRKLGLAGLFITILGTVLGLWNTHKADQETILPIQDRRVGMRAIVDAPAEARATDVARLTGRDINWNAANGGLEIEGVGDPLRQLFA